MDSEFGKWLIILLAAASMATTLWNYLRSRRNGMPPSARNDVKARRLWRCDPQAYARKYGEADRQIEANQKNRQDSL